MKRRISAVVRVNKSEDVREALNAIADLRPEITETSVRGTSRFAPEGRGFDALMPVFKLQLDVEEDMVGAVTDAIVQAARTGKPGDGLIWIEPVRATAMREIAGVLVVTNG